MDDSPKCAAIVGRSHSPEMQPVYDTVTQELRGWEVREFPHLAELMEAANSDQFFPDFVIVCQHFREEFSPADVESVFAILPLTRWIVVTGLWCESEGRHGSRWPMAVRVPVSGFHSRLQLECQVLRGDLPALALTAGREEVFAFQTQSVPPTFPLLRKTVLVVSPDREWKNSVEDFCRTTGWQLAEKNPQQTPEVLLVDLDPDPDFALAKLTQDDVMKSCPIIVGVKGLVAPEDHHRWKNAGVETVISKLALSFELPKQITHEIQRMFSGSTSSEFT